MINPVRVFRTVGALKAYLRPIQQEGLRVALVPTMGSLHDGHLSLVELARGQAELVVASIFVNPTQFGPRDDLDRYPRDEEGDRRKLARAGASVLFAPTVDEMYPSGFQTEVRVRAVSQGLCGAHRPGHFEGVATVVLKLLSIVHPDVAVFGEKDYQQWVVLRTLARDLNLDVQIRAAETVREPDGLARSSRNVYLSADERRRALSLSRGLFAARALFEQGERSSAVLEERCRAELRAEGVEAEYLELRHAETLAKLPRADAPAVLLVAAHIGSTRLIDNLILRRL